MPVRSVGFSCKLNMVVCPVPKIEGIGDPCVNPKMFPRASYKCHTTITLLIGFAPMFWASPFKSQLPKYGEKIKFCLHLEPIPKFDKIIALYFHF